MTTAKVSERPVSEVLGVPPAAHKARDRGFVAMLAALTSVALIVLAVLLLDTAIDGIPQLSLSFLTSFPSALPRTRTWPTP